MSHFTSSSDPKLFIHHGICSRLKRSLPWRKLRHQRQLILSLWENKTMYSVLVFFLSPCARGASSHLSRDRSLSPLVALDYGSTYVVNIDISCRSAAFFCWLAYTWSSQCLLPSLVGDSKNIVARRAVIKDTEKSRSPGEHTESYKG